MPVQQVPYEIPDNIMIKILTGEYVIKNERICYAEGPQRGKPVIFSDDPKKNAKLFDNNVLSYIKKQRDRIGKELDKKLSKLIKGDKKEQSKIRHAFEEVAEKVKENQPKINEAGKKAADAIKEKYGGADGGEDVCAQSMAHDAAVQACRIACHALYRGVGADELLRELPEVFVMSRSVSCAPAGRARTMRRLFSYAGEDASRDGIVKIRRPRGSVVICPEEGAERIVLHAQGETQEAARELCDFFDELIGKMKGDAAPGR